MLLRQPLTSPAHDSGDVPHTRPEVPPQTLSLTRSLAPSLMPSDSLADMTRVYTAIKSVDFSNDLRAIGRQSASAAVSAFGKALQATTVKAYGDEWHHPAVGADTDAYKTEVDKLQAQVVKIRSQGTALVSMSSDYANKANALRDAMSIAEANTVKLQSSSNYVLENQYGCGFDKEVFDNVYASVCQTSLNAVYLMAMCFLISGALALPMVICNSIMMLRLQEPGDDHNKVTPSDGGAPSANEMMR